MTLEEYNAYCKTLPASFKVVQWRGAHVWKVGVPDAAKVFAIGGRNEEGGTAITFKTSDLAYEILKDMPGLRPAPYLASRGMKWIQRHDEAGLSDDELRDYLKESHHIVSRGLTKGLQRRLGLDREAS